jgi:hypothetical protein
MTRAKVLSDGMVVTPTETRSGRTRGHAARTGFYDMLRDVLIASLVKGQFLIALGALILIILIVKLSSRDLGRIVLRMLDVVERGHIGYLLAGVSLFGWCLHAKYQRRAAVRELRRLSRERNRLRPRSLGDVVKSSEVSR